jgi:hypothetical protein
MRRLLWKVVIADEVPNGSRVSCIINIKASTSVAGFCLSDET